MTNSLAILSAFFLKSSPIKYFALFHPCFADTFQTAAYRVRETYYPIERVCGDSRLETVSDKQVAECFISRETLLSLSHPAEFACGSVALHILTVKPE